jgi:hypothetical protein
MPSPKDAGNQETATFELYDSDQEKYFEMTVYPILDSKNEITASVQQLEISPRSRKLRRKSSSFGRR